MKQRLIFAACFFLLTVIVQGQSFSSGSTGADGALDLAAMSCTTCEIQLPESGVLNYTTVNVPAGKGLTFKRNLRNTPVILLAQGSVNIAGTINVSIQGVGLSDSIRVPGPGGFHGGIYGQPGFGPGAGRLPPEDVQAKWGGPLSLVPIVGGSGGAGYGIVNGFGVVGSGGGGAIVIASSTTFVLSGSILANSIGNVDGTGYNASGSGGAIRLVASTLNVTGNLSAIGHVSAGVCCFGVIRLEAPMGALSFTGASNPPAVLSTINPTIVPSAAPSLNIVSIGGFTVPAYSGTRFDTVDLLLPNQLTDPINVVVQASNIPVGTQVKITFSGSPNATFTPGTLSGALASSTATLTVSNLNRSAVTYLFVSATFDPPTTSLNLNPKGKDRVAKVRVEAAPGAKPKFVFLRKDGSEIDPKKLPPAMLAQFQLPD